MPRTRAQRRWRGAVTWKMKAARLSSPLSPSCPVPPRPKCKRTPPESRYAVHQERGRRPRSPDGDNSLVSSLAEKGTESNRLVQKWRRAESRPLRKRGGEEEWGDASALSSGRFYPQTEPSPALPAPKRGPADGRGRLVGREVGGAGEGWGGQAGGAATLSSHLPKALACTRTPQLIHTHGDSTPEGELRVSASVPDATWRSLPDWPPATPDPAQGRGLQLTARRAARPNPPERWAPSPPLPLRAGPERAPK